LKDEATLLDAKKSLEDNGINTRRYFYPSLNTLSFIQQKQKCPVSEDISSRILCLPLYHDLKFEEVDLISKLVINCVKKYTNSKVGE
jgi:dTDP-4-amino-4,6-dideoxygalactose transaminase